VVPHFLCYSDSDGACSGIEDALDFLNLHQWLDRASTAHPFTDKYDLGAEPSVEQGQNDDHLKDSEEVKSQIEAQVRASEYVAALEHSDNLMKIRPSWTRTFMQRAEILEKLGRSKECESSKRVARALQNVQSLPCTWNYQRLKIALTSAYAATRPVSSTISSTDSQDAEMQSLVEEHKCSTSCCCKSCDFWEVRGWFLDWRRMEGGLGMLWSRTVRDYYIRILLIMKLAASPAKWQLLTKEPNKGQELSKARSCNAKLANALMTKSEFLLPEWTSFGVFDLRAEDYIKLGKDYFSTAPVYSSDQRDRFQNESEFPEKLLPVKRRHSMKEIKEENQRMRDHADEQGQAKIEIVKHLRLLTSEKRNKQAVLSSQIKQLEGQNNTLMSQLYIRNPGAVSGPPVDHRLTAPHFVEKKKVFGYKSDFDDITESIKNTLENKITGMLQRDILQQVCLSHTSFRLCCLCIPLS